VRGGYRKVSVYSIVEMMVMLDNAQLDELRIQPVGESEDMIDLICPPENIDAF
jgi:hypothetical protein